MYLYGASGHAKVIIDLLEERGINVEGLIDDNPNVDNVFGYKVEHQFTGNAPLIISIGSNRIRKILAAKLNVEYGTAIHPKAIVSKRSSIGEGTVVMAGSIIQADSQIGNHCIVNTGVSIDHECRLGNFVHVSPHATLCGNVQVGEGTWVGAGATIIQGVTIGKWCMIGAGSTVTKNIPDGTLFVSNRQNISRQCYKQTIEEMDKIEYNNYKNNNMLTQVKNGGGVKE